MNNALGLLMDKMPQVFPDKTVTILDDECPCGQHDLGEAFDFTVGGLSNDEIVDALFMSARCSVFRFGKIIVGESGRVHISIMGSLLDSEVGIIYQVIDGQVMPMSKVEMFRGPSGTFNDGQEKENSSGIEN